MAALFGNIKKAVKKGAKGADVKKIQIELGKQMKAKVKPDGDFGPATEQLIKDFQKKHKLKVDGVLGPKTLAVLESAANGVKDAAKGTADKLARFNGQKIIFKVLQESVRENNKDLKFYRQKLDALNKVLDAVQDDAQLAQYDLQMLVTQMAQHESAMSATMKKSNKAAAAIIKNLR